MTTGSAMAQHRRAVFGAVLALGILTGTGGCSSTEPRSAHPGKRTTTTAETSVTGPVCAGTTNRDAVGAIEQAYFHFLDGTQSPIASQKVPYLQFLSPPHESPSLLALFEAVNEQNLEVASTTSVLVHRVTCTSKTTALVRFDFVLGGTLERGIAPRGHAVLEQGTWKVAGETLCRVMALTNPDVNDTGPCAEILSDGRPSDITS